VYRLEVFFVNGKQKKRKVRLIGRIQVSEFVEQNANDLFLGSSRNLVGGITG
jgi:hypothetical protein